ncbi:MAG TPA: 50S ribosomal protein L3 N(5)-glutamine methyltransferase [Aestuariivirgaceae bacterium]
MTDSLDQRAAELLTLRDLFRYAVSRFSAAKLSYGQGAGSALDEAAFLLLESLNLPIEDINPFADARLTLAERKLLLARIEERVLSRKPAAYILNKAYIAGIPFYVDERVIVPRSFIGELLMSGRLGEEGFGLIDEPEKIATVLDLCTGSACLAIVAARLFQQARIDAADLSKDALEVARRNVAESGEKTRITLYKGDLFAPLPPSRRYDLILANPPYVDEEAMASLPPEYRHEPAMALDGGSDGLDVVRRILGQAKDRLTQGGLLICEIGRARTLLEEQFPEFEFLWLDTEESSGEVFCLASAGWR